MNVELDWPSLFVRVHDLPPGASEDELAALAGWWPSATPIPDDYSSFLRWSNGPAVDWYDWSFGFFSTVDIVEYAAAYESRRYMSVQFRSGSTVAGSSPASTGATSPTACRS
jgi:hypothetical protein